MKSKPIAPLLHGVVLVVLLGMLAACGGQSAGQPSAGGATSAPAAQPQGNVELTLWDTFTDDASAPYVNQLKAAKAALPNVTINDQATPHDQYKIKVKTQAAGGVLPDIIQVWPGAELEPLVRGGVLLPIDSIVGEWKDKLLPADQLNDYAIDGKQYAIPAVANYTHLIYYNKKLLASAGYSQFPSTYDDFKALITKLAGQGVTPIALGNKGKWVLQSCYISVIADRVTGDQFLHDVLVTKQKKFTDPEFIRALGIIKELADLKAFNADMNNLDNNQQREVLLQGRAAMMIEGSWASTDLAAKMPKDFDLGVAAFPAVAGGKGDPKALPGVTGVGFALNAKLSPEKRAAAEQFLKAYYTPALYSALLKSNLLVPAKVETPADIDPTFKQVFALTTSSKITPVYDAVLPAAATDAINNGLQAIAIGSSTPEQVAQELQSIVDSQ